jgi:malate synthase
VYARTVTPAGLAINLDVGLQYLASWLGGNGCVPIYNLMEDAATAEICRAQVWQWLRHRAAIDGGHFITPALVRGMLHQTAEKLGSRVPARQLSAAVRLYEQMLDPSAFAECLTLGAYEYLD